MKAQVRFFDHDSLTEDELVARVKEVVGSGKVSSIEVYPDSNDPLDHIYFGIQQLITTEQLDVLFTSESIYSEKLQLLRARVLGTLTTELDKVIADNERKVSGES